MSKKLHKAIRSHTQLLEGVDPALQKVFLDFEKEAKHVFEAWETQKKLFEKYSKLSEEGRLRNHLQAEADYKWQCTKLYLAKAQPVSGDQGMVEEGYNVAEDWARMRRRHAEECFEFICKHQKQCVALYEQEVSLAVLQEKLTDRLDAWFAEQAFDDLEVQRVLKQRACQFAQSFVRATRRKIQTWMVKDKEQQRREQVLLGAKSKWEQMDVKDVLSPALFELLDAKQERSCEIKEDSALAFLVKDNEELCRRHNVKIVSEAARSSKRAPTPKKAPGKIRGRSQQRGSSTPRSILQVVLHRSQPDCQVVRELRQRESVLKGRVVARAKRKAKARASRSENSTS